MGLDRSWPSSTSFVRNLARGDFGTSFQYRPAACATSTSSACRTRSSSPRPLADLAAHRHPAGIITAVKVDTIWDTFCKVIAMLGLSIPASSWAC